MTLDPNDIKQVFFYCDHRDPNGFYANDVDVLEFGQKIAAFALAQKKPMSEDQLLDFMYTVKVRQNGDELLTQMKTLVKAIEEFHGIR